MGTGRLNDKTFGRQFSFKSFLLGKGPMML